MLLNLFILCLEKFPILEPLLEITYGIFANGFTQTCLITNQKNPTLSAAAGWHWRKVKTDKTFAPSEVYKYFLP